MLEPFGLLNFIQSALKNAPPSAKEEWKNPPPDEPKNDVPNHTSNTPSEPSTPSNWSPFLDFCKLHDERAKRIKKGK